MEDSLGYEFFAKVLGFEKLADAAKKVDKLKKNAEQASGSIGRFNKVLASVGQVGQRMGDWGGKMMMQTGLVFHAAQDLSRRFYTVIDAFGSVEQKSKELKTVLQPLGGDIKKSVDLATNSALEFSKKYSASATEIMEAQYLVASAGISEPLITIKAAEWTMKVARATRQDLSSTANIWASVANTFYDAGKMTEEEMQSLSDVLTKTQQKFQFADLYQLGDGMKYAGSAARTMHVPIQTTATLLGILNSTGIQGTMAGTSLQQTFLKLTNVQKKLGVRLKYTKDGTLDVIDAFKKIKAKIEGLPPAERVRIIQQAFGDRAFKAVMTIIDKIDQVEGDLAEVSGAAGVTEKSFLDLEDSVNAKFARMRNNLSRLFYTIGEKFAPILNRVIERIIKIVDAIDTFAEKNPLLAKIAGSVAGIGAAFAGIGMPIITFVGMFAWGAGNVITGAIKMTKGIQAVIGVMKMLNAIKVTSALTSGFSGISTAVGGLMGKLVALKASLASLAASAGPLFLVAAGAVAIYGTIKMFEFAKTIQENEEEIQAKKNQLDLIKKHRQKITQYQELEAKLMKGVALSEKEQLSYKNLRYFMETGRSGLYKKMIKYEPIVPPGQPKPPTPEDMGITTPMDITADTRPQIDNYYYTIHFERDAIQINTLEMTPEKFARAFEEFLKLHSLAPEPA